jgi:hypothetical protein
MWWLLWPIGDHLGDHSRISGRRTKSSLVISGFGEVAEWLKAAVLPNLAAPDRYILLYLNVYCFAWLSRSPIV